MWDTMLPEQIQHIQTSVGGGASGRTQDQGSEQVELNANA